MNRTLIAVLLVVIFIFSCATQFTYYDTLRRLIGSEDYAKASSLVEEKKMVEYGEKNALLYWMDKGIIAHYAQDYETSISAFERAEKLAEELFTKSISEEAASFLTSDYAKSFYGEDFERVFINVFQSLNYLLLRKYEDALVEARKVDHKLRTLEVNYGHKNVYKEDAFMKYLTGLIYESQNEINNAFVSLRQSLDIYTTNNKIYQFSTPKDLIIRMLKLANYLGFKDEIKEISNKFKSQLENLDYQNLVSQRNKFGELVVIHYNGFAPYKVDHFIEISFGEGWAYVGSMKVSKDEEADVQNARRLARSIASNEQIVVAFPKYESVPNQIESAEIEIFNNKNEKVASTKTFLVEDIDTIARKCLDDRIARIRAKTIARAAVKYVLTHAVSQRVQKNTDEFTGWLAKKALQITAAATEKADKRSWRLLPKYISFAMKELEPNNYRLEIKFVDRNNQVVVKKIIPEIKITSGKKSFLIVRTVL